MKITHFKPKELEKINKNLQKDIKTLQKKLSLWQKIKLWIKK